MCTFHFGIVIDNIYHKHFTLHGVWYTKIHIGEYSDVAMNIDIILFYACSRSND